MTEFRENDILECVEVNGFRAPGQYTEGQYVNSKGFRAGFMWRAPKADRDIGP